MDQSRRDFLLKVAAGSAYAAPLIRSIAAPEGVAGQSPTGKGGGMPNMTTTTDFEPSFGPSAPWSIDP